MASNFTWVGLVIASVWFAGCAGSTAQAPAASQPSSVVEATGAPIGEGGTITGTVVDDALSPIAGAQVAILELALAATTDVGGAFQFRNVPAGSYNLVAAALGYESFAKRVEVVALGEVVLTVTLIQIEVFEPFIEVIGPIPGYFECRVARPGVPGVLGGSTGSCHSAISANDKSSQNFTMYPHTEGFVGEMRWNQGSFATSQRLRMSFSYEGRPGTHWWCTSTSTTPIKWEYAINADGEGSCLTPPYCGIASTQMPASTDYPVPKVGDTLLTYTNTPFTCQETDNFNAFELAFQQRFEMIITMFQGQPIPPGYSAFDDA
jgi:hypothetical protein